MGTLNHEDPAAGENGTRGMTLVEIIIVVAIVGIMAGIGIVSWRSYLPRQRLNASARVLAADLLEARQLAVKENRMFYTIFYLPTKQYKVFRVSAGLPCTDTGSGASSGAGGSGGGGSGSGGASSVDTTSCDDGASDDGAGNERLYLTGKMQAGVDMSTVKTDTGTFTKVYFCPTGLIGLGAACVLTSNSFPLHVILTQSGTLVSLKVTARVSGAISVN